MPSYFGSSSHCRSACHLRVKRRFSVVAMSMAPQQPFSFYIQNPDGTLTLTYGLPPAGYVEVSGGGLPSAQSMVTTTTGAFPSAQSMVTVPTPAPAPAVEAVASKEIAAAVKKSKKSKKKKSSSSFGCC